MVYQECQKKISSAAEKHKKHRSSSISLTAVRVAQKYRAIV